MLTLDFEKQLSSFNLKVNLKQDSGILGFLGSSGSGKSLSLKCIAGLEKPSKGKITLNNKCLFHSNKKINLSSKERNIGFLFQNYALFPHMKIRENIEIGISNMNTFKKNKMSTDFIERFSLNGLENKYPWQLSGGQQQRVALARALITNPDILLLDEPFSALDYHLRLNMEKELISILKSYGGHVIFVTHDIAEAYRICNNIIVYDNGKALNNREKYELFKSPKTLTEAKITGCKNISRAKKINDKTILAIDWNNKYTVADTVPNNIEFIGIRAHHIEITTQNYNYNTYPFYVENIVENPFNFSISVKSPSKLFAESITFFLDKKSIDFSINDLIHLQFNKENLFYF